MIITVTPAVVNQIIEDGENGEDRAARYSRLRTDWFTERVAHSHELAGKQNPAPTESQAV